MSRSYRVGLWIALVAIAIPAFAVASDPEQLGGSRDATITAGRSPEPPLCAQPTTMVDMWWDITYSTTPDFVYYQLRDPNGVTVEESTYVGTTGVTVSRQWEVPVDPELGKYWIRVEFHSVDVGHESTAEVSFYVCSGNGRIYAEKWEDMDCDGAPSGPDRVVEGWWICIQTPWGDEFCQQTNASGYVEWTSLPLGEYTVSEEDRDGWLHLNDPTRTATLTEANPEWLGAFFNVRYDQCFGACCECGGDCQETTMATCEQLGPQHLFMGLGTHCKEVDCSMASAAEKESWSTIKDRYR